MYLQVITPAPLHKATNDFSSEKWEPKGNGMTSLKRWKKNGHFQNSIFSENILKIKIKMEKTTFRIPLKMLTI